MAHNFYIDNQNSETTYGLTFLQGTYQELLKLPAVKPGLENNWRDQHGTDRDVTARKFESRQLSLPVLLKGESKEDFVAKLNAFQTFCLTAGYFNLDAEGLNRRFIMLYKEVSNYEDADTFATFNLVLIDDYPATIQAIPI